MRKLECRREALFQYRGLPPVGMAVSMALQHLVAMIVGCVTPAIIIANVAGLAHFLLRFREDVIKLAPALVVINAGTNDIAENAGAYNEEYTFGNIVSMVELARANKIKVILTSVLPAAAFGWNPSVKDAPQKIMQLNARIRKYAQENKIPYVDYYSEMVEGDNKALNSSYTRDGVHPTLEGYKVMEALIKKAIDKVL